MVRLVPNGVWTNGDSVVAALDLRSWRGMSVSVCEEGAQISKGWNNNKAQPTVLEVAGCGSENNNEGSEKNWKSPPIEVPNPKLPLQPVVPVIVTQRTMLWPKERD